MARLIIVTYHYVRDLPNTPFPRIKGLLTGEFAGQVERLMERYEMAGWDSLTAFLRGEYTPRRDLCYLTFDDGFKDHYANVLPILAEKRLTAGFFPITACLETAWVAPVHKNHFLMAALDFQDLYQRFVRLVREVAPGSSLEVDPHLVRQLYRWDEPEVAAYKYFVNHALGPEIRERVLDLLFAEALGDQRPFAAELYMSWKELQEMQRLGMTIGGHSHRHRPLSSLSQGEQRHELQSCHQLLLERCPELKAPPFCYPYGNPQSFTEQTAALVREAGFSAAMTTISGWNYPGASPYLLHRVDTREVERA